jgi:hypothetical protein
MKASKAKKLFSLIKRDLFCGKTSKHSSVFLAAIDTSAAGLAIFHPGTFHGTFRPVSTGIR